MSYILDALRKADAQRERDPARGIHAQPVAAPAPVAPAWRKLAVWGGVALVAGVAAVLLWPQSGERVQVASAPAPQPVSAPAPTAAIATAAPAEQVLPAAPPMPAPVTAPAPVAAAAPAAKPSAVPPQAKASEAAAPAPQRVPAFNELPAETQREIPKLVVSGAVYSANAAQRMLVVNGQVVNEGAQLAPELVLEQIGPRSATLRWRSQRFSLAY